MLVYIRGMQANLEVLEDNTYSVTVMLPSGVSLTAVTAEGQGMDAVERLVVALWDRGMYETEIHKNTPCDCDVAAKRQRS